MAVASARPQLLGYASTGLRALEGRDTAMEQPRAAAARDLLLVEV